MAEGAYPPYPPCYSCKDSACSTFCYDQECCARGYRWIWPETVGKDPELTTELILQTNPLVTVAKAPEGTPVGSDFCCNRVWLFLDAKGNVAKVPKVG